MASSGTRVDVPRSKAAKRLRFLEKPPRKTPQERVPSGFAHLSPCTSHRFSQMQVYNSGGRTLNTEAGLRNWLTPWRTIMLKYLVASFLMLAVAAPALAKRPDVYPVSCNDLWAAVHDTLDNPSNYATISMDDIRQRAQFVVIGARGHYTQKVELKARDGGCLANATSSKWAQTMRTGANSIIDLRSRQQSCRRQSPNRRQW